MHKDVREKREAFCSDEAWKISWWLAIADRNHGEVMEHYINQARAPGNKRGEDVCAVMEHDEKVKGN